MKMKLRSLTIIMGATLALAIVFSQVFHIQIEHSQKEIRTEKQSSPSGDEAHYTVLSTFSIPAPAACIELDVESFCLFEISFEAETEVSYLQDIPRYTSQFLQTLFRVIISPNAP